MVEATVTQKHYEHSPPAVRWHFPSELVQVRAARAAITGLLPARCARADDVVLVAGELAANAVEHSTGAVFTVELTFTDMAVELAVRDGGSDTVPELLDPTEPLASLDVEADPNVRERGRGLRLVEAYADAWGHYTGPVEATVWTSFRLDNSPQTIVTAAENNASGNDVG